MKEPAIESELGDSAAEAVALGSATIAKQTGQIVRKGKARRKQAKQFELVTCQLYPSDLRSMLVFAAICFSLTLMVSVWVTNWYIMVFGILLSVLAFYGGQLRSMKVRFDRDGFKIVSLNFAGMMGTFRNGVWSDVHSIRLAYELPQGRIFDPFCGSWAKSGFLVFDLSSGGYLLFPLAGLDSTNLEKLFTSLAKWASPLVENPDVLSMQRGVLTQGAFPTDLTFTRIWEESLKSGFETTNFVPLTGGHNLLNGDYRVILLLVCGGLSAVYLAEKSDGRKVVLKEMHLPMGMADATRQKALELFEREARILATLHHDQIAKVLDYFTEAGRTYLVIEHIPGCTLRQLVQLKGTLDEKRVLILAKQAANILYYMHNCKPAIIHRDLTPDNLIVKSDDTLMLIDFGAATEMVENATGTLIGKQSYIPPEQFRGKACTQSDIYSLGGTMHYLLTGRDPEPLSQSHPRLLEPDVSVSTDALVADCTAFEAAARIQSAEQLTDRIATLLNGNAAANSGNSYE